MAVMRPESDPPPPPSVRKILLFLLVSILAIGVVPVGDALIHGWNPLAHTTTSTATAVPTRSGVPVVIEPTDTPTAIPTPKPSPTAEPTVTPAPTATPPTLIQSLELVDGSWVDSMAGTSYNEKVKKIGGELHMRDDGFAPIALGSTFRFTTTLTIDAQDQKSVNFDFVWTKELKEYDVIYYVYRLSSNFECRSVPIFVMVKRDERLVPNTALLKGISSIPFECPK